MNLGPAAAAIGRAHRAILRPAKARAGRRENVTLAVLTTAGFAFAFQQMMLVPALRVLEKDFDTTAAWVSWVFTVFLLSSCVATPVLGRLGDRFGKERLLVASLALFFLGSVLAIFAWNIWSLITFRAVQGAGGAVIPLGLAIIRDEFPPERVAVGMGVVASAFGLGGPAGIIVAGLVLEDLSWRWLFVIGAAVIGLAIVLVQLLIPESPIKSPARLDIRSTLFFGSGLILLLVALTEGNSWGWSSSAIFTLFASSLVALTWWCRRELGAAHPMIDVRTLAQRQILLTNLSSLLGGFTSFGVFLLIPIFVQAPRDLPAGAARLVDYGFNAGPLEVALYLLPLTLVQVVSAPLAGILGYRYGSKAPFVIGTGFLALGAAFLATWNDRPWQVAFGMLVVGAGVGMTFATTPKLITDAVSQTDTGVANGVNTIMRTIGGMIGGQLGVAIVAANTVGSTSIADEAGYVVAFWLYAGASVAAMGLAFMLAAGPSRREDPAQTPTSAAWQPAAPTSVSMSKSEEGG